MKIVFLEWEHYDFLQPSDFRYKKKDIFYRLEKSVTVIVIRKWNKQINK